MSRVRVRWQACVPASKQNHQGRVTGRRSESSLPAQAGTALEEKLPGTTVILVAVPAASALISSPLPQPGTRANARYTSGTSCSANLPVAFPSLPRFVCVPRTSAGQVNAQSFSFGLAHAAVNWLYDSREELSTNFVFVYFIILYDLFFLIRAVSPSKSVNLIYRKIRVKRRSSTDLWIVRQAKKAKSIVRRQAEIGQRGSR